MRNRLKKSGVAIVLVGIFIALGGVTGEVAAADLFVSDATGNDAAAGTFSAPFKTVYKAKQVAQTLPRIGPINIFIRSGTYRLDSALVFGPADGGTAQAPVTYSAYCGDSVVLSGGKKVTTAWMTYSGSIMVTTIGTGVKCDQLFLNGMRQVLARYPNFNANQLVLNGYASWSSITARTSKWKTPTQGPGYIRSINSSLWGGEDFYITSVSGTTINTTWVGDNNRGNTMNQNQVVVENLFEELDTAGEWYYNKSTGQLFFWPPSGTNLSTATVELASQNCLLRFAGTAPATVNSVSYITFNRVNFTQTYRTLFDGTYENILMSDWSIVRNGTVFMQNTEHITVQNCLFDQIGGNGIFMSGYNRYDVVYNNVFSEGGASPVLLFGLTSAVRCPNSWSSTPTCSDLTPGSLTSEFPAYIRIDNNLMNHFGRFEKQSAGVSLSVTAYDTIRHNTIQNCPRAGLNVCEGNFGGHVFEFNDISHCVQETGDHGPWNGWGRDRFWTHGGYCTNGCNGATRKPYSLLDAMSTSHIRNNRLQDNDGRGGFGIDLDDGCTNYWIYNNLTIHCGIKLREGFVRKVYNNIIFHDALHCHVWYAQCCDTALRNIIVNDTPYDFASMSLSSMAGCQALLDYNLMWKPGGTVRYTPGSGQDGHSKLNADPLFTDTASWNFTVKSGSPALALGFVNFPMDSFGRMPVASTALCPTTGTGPQHTSLSATHDLYCSASSSVLTIHYRLDRDSRVSIDLCTLNGKKVAAIANGFEKGGEYHLSWKGRSGLAMGSYLVVVAADGEKKIRKIVF